MNEAVATILANAINNLANSIHELAVANYGNVEEQNEPDLEQTMD